MRKGSAHVIIILAVATLLIGGLVYYALNAKRAVCAAEVSGKCLPPTPLVTVTQPPVKTGYRRAVIEEMTVDIPESWQEIIDDPSESVRTYKEFDASTGDYISVTIGGGGRTNPSDAIWKYEVDGSSPRALVSVREEDDSCLKSDALCVVGDGKLDIYVSAENAGSINIFGGNLYSMYIGNSKGETTDRGLYRNILKSVRFK